MELFIFESIEVTLGRENSNDVNWPSVNVQLEKDLNIALGH